MIRKLKFLGLALPAILALSAMAAAGASANGELSAEAYPFTLDGTDVAEQQNAFTAFGGVVECPDSSYGGEAVGGGEIEAGTEAITVVPGYNNPKCKAEELKATVKANGCDYVIHVGETGGVEEYAATADVVCPKGKTIEILVYLSPSNENVLACKIKIGAQTGLGGATIADTLEGVEVGGTLNGIHAEEEGLCGAGTTSKAEYDLAVGLSGTDGSQDPIGIALVDGSGKLTTESGEGVTLDVTELGSKENRLTAFGESAECPGSTYKGHEVGSAGGLIPEGATEATITPEYKQEGSNCRAQPSNLPATIDTNGCDYVLHLGKTDGLGGYEATADVVCPAEKHIQVTVFTGTSHLTKVCTLTITDAVGLSGAHISNGEGDWHVTGAILGLVIHRVGACAVGEKTDENGKLDLNLTATGTNEASKEIGITISHG